MTIEVIDLSSKRHEHQRHVYKTLLRNWWPHPIHGSLAMSFTPETMMFRCACGAVLHLHHHDAQALGFI